MNYLILGDKIYTPNACPVQNYDGCGENDGCYNYDSHQCPCKVAGGRGKIVP